MSKLHPLDRLPAAPQRRQLLAASVALAALAAAPIARADEGRGDDDRRVSCRPHFLRVSLAAGAPETSWIFGQLCSAGERAEEGSAVQVLLHGATYDHAYWDYGRVDGVDYSYARTLAAAGIPTFAIDNLGAGLSSRPVSTEVTFDTSAYVAHQVVQALRSGAIERTRFSKVILVGNSLGALTAWAEANTFRDVDGVIATGMIHHFSQTVVQILTAQFYPANQDPAFAHAGLDDGYLTTRPGSRGAVFFDANDGDADPAVIAVDERRKEAVLGVFIAQGLPQVLVDHDAINVPVLALIGHHDVFCDGGYDCTSSAAVIRQEAPFYGPNATVAACAVPATAHSISLHVQGHVTQEAASINWTRAVLRGKAPKGAAAPGCSR